MKRPPLGSYEEARIFQLSTFQRLSPTQKLQWLSEMMAFVDAANPAVRQRRFGRLFVPHAPRKRPHGVG